MRQPAAAEQRGDGRNIVLIGPMGSGKSTVGAALARRLHRPHVDSDHFFVARHGPIPAYFSLHGEQVFRAEEENIVAELLDSPRPSVISLGGGSVLSPRTRELLRDQLVILLDLTEHQAALRLGDGSTRPILGAHPVEAWKRIYAEREQIYRDCADIVMTPDDAHIDVRVDHIVRALNTTSRRDPSV
ncbi:shikimate kinase [Nesterenkonia sandarakina]|uniref:Shikimate kinase n=1 Tax=Nesterenkonia sandarakina TaxID=272918 RepID=A0A2T0YLH8_9MICC|nr:shikimate kinase [Nesterenkonia sandarakina]PRZ16134.1 shikimate kinase [Nesterenkonia sandarakina]